MILTQCYHAWSNVMGRESSHDKHSAISYTYIIHELPPMAGTQHRSPWQNPESFSLEGRLRDTRWALPSRMDNSNAVQRARVFGNSRSHKSQQSLAHEIGREITIKLYWTLLPMVKTIIYSESHTNTTSSGRHNNLENFTICPRSDNTNDQGYNRRWTDYFVLERPLDLHRAALSPSTHSIHLCH